MTATNAPTIRFVKTKVAVSGRKQRFGFRCTCRQWMNCTSEAEIQRLAQQHSDWHFDRGEPATIELGGLL